MTSMTERAMTFDNGLSCEEAEAIDDTIIAIAGLISQVEALGRHRSYSLAVTKLEEAKHWLRDRNHKPA